MDVYDILSRLENITKLLQDNSKEKAKNDFNKSLGIDKEQYESVIDKMAEDAMASGSPSNTRKEISIEDVKNIYRSLIG